MTDSRTIAQLFLTGGEDSRWRTSEKRGTRDAVPRAAMFSRFLSEVGKPKKRVSLAELRLVVVVGSFGGFVGWAGGGGPGPLRTRLRVGRGAGTIGRGCAAHGWDPRRA